MSDELQETLYANKKRQQMEQYHENKTKEELQKEWKREYNRRHYLKLKKKKNELRQSAAMNPNDNDENEESPPLPVETITKAPTSKRARLKDSGQDEDEYDREQMLIKDVHANSMKALESMSSQAIAAIQQTGQRREAHRLERLSLSTQKAHSSHAASDP